MSYKKRLERKLKEANLDLEQKVRQRTAQLERQNKELEQFAYIASHDLQEPLRTISSMTNLLAAEYTSKLDEVADQYLKYTVSASQRMSDLITGLLIYSRIGRFKSQKTVDCNQLVDDIIQDLQFTIKETDARIKVGKLPVIIGSQEELKVLFQNLISNALKFRMNGKSPEVVIAVKEKKEDYEFTVKDNGIGIDPKYFKKGIYHISALTHPKRVQWLWHWTFAQQEDRRVARWKNMDYLRAWPWKHIPLYIKKTQNNPNMRRKLKCILLVDDDEPTNFVNSILLRKAEISESIVAFQWGEEALDYLVNKNGFISKSDEHPVPDLILLDINMPKMNGWEFVDEYKKLPIELLNSIKLIMLTTSINPDDEAKAKSIKEIHDFFSKPLTSNRVADIVHKHFVDYV